MNQSTQTVSHSRGIFSKSELQRLTIHQSASGPRPKGRLLRQPALEILTRSAWMDSPQKVGRSKVRGGGGGTWRARRRRRLGEEGGGQGGLGLGFVSCCTRNPDEISVDGFSSKSWPEQGEGRRRRHVAGTAAAAAWRGGRRPRWARVSTCVTLNGSGIQLAVGPQPLWLRNHNSGLAHRIMVRASSNIALGITDSACKNQLVVVSVQYGPFNPYIPIRSTNIGKSRVSIDPIAMHTSWRSNSDIVSVTSIGYPRMSASGESSTTMHRLLHVSGSHPILPPNEPNIGYPRMSVSGESSTTMHRLLHASGSHPIPPPNDPNFRATIDVSMVLGVFDPNLERSGSSMVMTLDRRFH
ncbi:protein EXPORTIN 1A-like [Dorcoceras hygrometricum]|uniref:Protein EXPORTIN 1A-like n=1 Tax=Dorcoceras hygrometricum TaxID=472368 RepID=A0A2Z7BEX5_9LAMI|nr:protein EXPORTIN 1A-like [Dorcoceras hygrometricum]